MSCHFLKTKSRDPANKVGHRLDRFRIYVMEMNGADFVAVSALSLTAILT